MLAYVGLRPPSEHQGCSGLGQLHLAVSGTWLLPGVVLLAEGRAPESLSQPSVIYGETGVLMV